MFSVSGGYDYLNIHFCIKLTRLSFLTFQSSSLIHQNSRRVCARTQSKWFFAKTLFPKSHLTCLSTFFRLQQIRCIFVFLTVQFHLINKATFVSQWMFILTGLLDSQEPSLLSCFNVHQIEEERSFCIWPLVSLCRDYYIVKWFPSFPQALNLLWTF